MYIRAHLTARTLLLLLLSWLFDEEGRERKKKKKRHGLWNSVIDVAARAQL